MYEADQPKDAGYGSGQPAVLFDRADPCLAGERRLGEHRFLARAPGRLDVMGGIAEYTGALVLAATTRATVSVTVQPRDDTQIVVYERAGGNNGKQEAARFELAELASGGDRGLIERIGERVRAVSATPWLAPIVGAVHSMLATEKVSHAGQGATIVADGDLPCVEDLGFRASSAVAVLLALGEAWGVRMDALECARLAERAEHDLADLPCAMSAALTALAGQAQALVQIDPTGQQPNRAVLLPDGVKVVGIDCGMKSADAGIKYKLVRAATIMGSRVIADDFARRSGQGVSWNGQLAALTIEDYVSHLRDRIPTKIRGSDFLERFGQHTDPLTEVVPNWMYKIRSRTEHHIYEATRVRQFIERCQFAQRTGNRSALAEAGELMLASHWSYGQRCGLGSIQTDLLVNLLKKKSSSGIYGAKISGTGSGGVVVVLLEDNAPAREALADAIGQYEQATKLKARVFETGAPGAVEFSVHRG